MLQLALANLRYNLSRLVATLIAIAIGIGFMLGGGMLTDSLSVSLGGAVEAQYPTIDVVVRHESAGDGSFQLPASVLDEIRDVDGVKSAVGETSAAVGIRKGDGRAATMPGRLWLDSESIANATIDDGRAPSTADEIALDRATSASRDIEIGDTVTLTDAAGNRDVKVVGITSFGGIDAADPQGTTTLAPDQHVALGAEPGASDRILVDVDDGMSADAVIARLDRVLADGFLAADRDDFVESSIGGLGAIASTLSGPLRGFAFLALFVCGFVIANTYAAVLGQRTRELGLIRAIAATPWQVSRSVWFEAVGLGLIGSAVGIGFGFGVVNLTRSLLDRFADVRLPGGNVLRPGEIALAVGLGVLIPVASVSVAAIRAGRIAPVEAMRSGVVEPRQRSVVLSVLSLLILGTGVGMLFLGGSADGVLSGVLLGLGALVFVGGLLVSGRVIVRAVARALHPLARFGMATRLATDNLARNPKRTASTANALVVGVLLISLVSVVGNALKGEIVGLFGDDSTVDFTIAAETAIPNDVVRGAAKIDGVEAAVPVPFAFAVLDDQPNGVAVVDPADLERLESVVVLEGSLDDLGSDGIAVVDPTTFDLGDRGGVAESGDQNEGAGGGEQDEPPFADEKPAIGNVIDVQAPDGSTRTATIRATLEFNFDVVFLMNVVTPEFAEGFIDVREPQLMVLDVDDERYNDVSDELDELIAPYPTVQVSEGNIVASVIGDVLDVLVWVVNGLLGMSVAVAVIGIINTMSLSIFERRRELGLLRAVGMSARSARRMVRWEAVLISVIGTAIGVLGGLSLALLLLRPVELDSFSIPWTTLGGVALAGLAVGLFSSTFAVWRVSRLNVLESLQP